MPVDDPIDFLPPGQPVDLDTCAREPIHTPGSVQPHGVLVVAREADGTIVQTSANAALLFSGGPDALLGENVYDLFASEASARFTEAFAGVTVPAIAPARVNLAYGRAVDTHTFSPAEGLLAIEIEPAAEDEPDALTAIGRVARWSAALQRETTLDGMAAVAASALRDLTGFDRVWTYRFQPDGHGVIIAEDCNDDLESFLGLHFPEGDIPRQARDLYVRNRVRVIPDVAADVAPLVPLENPETDAWLDLSGGALRAVSPMHIRYLGNMGVRASMSVSLVVDGRLWGLVSAHHYAGPRAVPVRVRGECELLGTLASMQLAAASELERTRHGLELQRSVNHVIEAMAASESFIDGLVSVPDEVLGLCDATGAILALGETRHLIGETPPQADVDRLIAVLAEQPGDVVTIDALETIAPDLGDLTPVAAGVVAFPLSRRQGNWLIWLRPETVQEVTWGNRDKDLVRRDPTGVMELGQRESFERWAEEVRGRARPWAPAEVDAVANLRAAVGALLITRTEKLARLNEELSRSNTELDAFAYAAAHDLREPVRGIEQFAGFFLEDFGDDLTDDGRTQMATIVRLAQRMDGLLESLLDYAQLGDDSPRRTTVHLPGLVDEVRELLSARLGDDVRIEVEDVSVDADQEGLRQLLLNLIWNAAKYTDEPPQIEIGIRSLSDAEGGEAHVRRSLVGDDEPVAIYVRDRGIGIDPEHHEVIFELFRRLHAKDEFGGGSGAGLTLCRRIVERHGGAIWVESAPGHGSTFNFTLEPA